MPHEARCPNTILPPLLQLHDLKTNKLDPIIDAAPILNGPTCFMFTFSAQHRLSVHTSQTYSYMQTAE
ncbi:hypothetical protein GOBAR_DD06986 [Gossypium barbadense]|nr:hypothetical protein GOBAR_DD06986 [Gossypium barbadense]